MHHVLGAFAAVLHTLFPPCWLTVCVPAVNVVITPSRYEQIQKWVASGPDGRDEDTALFPATSPKPSS